THLFNNFSTGVEKFLDFKTLTGWHLPGRDLGWAAILCQPGLPPPRYGAADRGVKTFWERLIGSAEKSASGDTCTHARNSPPGNAGRFAVWLGPQRSSNCAFRDR